MKNREFEEYYNQYYAQAVGYAFKKTNDYDLAEELVMNAFYSCYLKFDAFDPQKASFGTWFYFVLNNKIKNYYRDHKNHEDIDQVIYATELFEDEVVAAVELSRIRNDLKIALDMLPNMQRRIIILKYFYNNSLGICGSDLRNNSPCLSYFLRANFPTLFASTSIYVYSSFPSLSCVEKSVTEALFITLFLSIIGSILMTSSVFFSLEMFLFPPTTVAKTPLLWSGTP